MKRIILVFASLSIATVASAEPVNFNREIRPLLSNNCFKCHGPDADERQGGLRLDTEQGALAESDSGRAIVPGKPDASLLIQRITSIDPDGRMPPADAGLTLKPEQVELLRRWVAEGAQWQKHWSLEPPVRSPLPEVRSATQLRGPIDHYVQARLEARRLSLSPEASRYDLVRRVTLDLTGLPPTIAEADAFASDERPDAYERVVDRLLASPAYGERWARVWLDLARFADSAGYAQDPERTIWRYRDWVIDAINANMPFDQFTIEQLAGDMLDNPTEDQLLATAFHRNTMTNSEGGTDDEEFRIAAVVDRVNTTMQVWMGLTMECAQCHTHKYDPLTQEEYYGFMAVFNSTEDADRGDESPTLVTYSSDEQREQERLRGEIARLEAAIAQQAAPTNNGSAATSEAALQPQLAEAKKRLAGIRGAPTPIMRELPPNRTRLTHIHIRGDFRNKGALVQPGVPAALHPLPEGAPANRLSVARWLVSRENPLAARVLVNRYWEQLFGVGIVETAEDFGVQGEPPSQPELLDYLAVELMEHGWDTKHLVREIVLSATYRQTSRTTPALVQADPNNRLLARGPCFRLSAEQIRDQALFVGGLLSKKMHGPSVRPLRPKLGLASAFGGSTDWEPSPGEDRYRRGLYTSWRRTTPYPSFMTFDATSREVCTIRRIRTNTPLQALVTMNDPVYIEAAQALARRALLEGGDDTRARVTYAFRLAVTRPPSDGEHARLVALHEQLVSRYKADAAAAQLMATVPLGPAPQGMDIADLAAWTVVGNVLLNLDETLARR